MSQTTFLDTERFGYKTKLIHSDPDISIATDKNNNIIVTTRSSVDVFFNDSFDCTYNIGSLGIYANVYAPSHQNMTSLVFGPFDLIKHSKISNKKNQMLLNHFGLVNGTIGEIYGISTCNLGGIFIMHDPYERIVRSKENEIVLFKHKIDAYVIISGQKYMFDVLEIRDTIE